MKQYRKLKKLKIKKKQFNNELPNYNEYQVKHISNDRIEYLKNIMGIDRKNNFSIKNYVSINKQMRISNKLQNCSCDEIEELESECEIFYYDKIKKEDILIEGFTNDEDLEDFFITIQPNVNVCKDRIKDLFTLFLCKWGYFLYGRKYPEKLSDKFIVFFEKNNYEHIHLLLMDFNVSKIRMYLGYIQRFFDIFFNDAYVYAKIADNREDVLSYGIKNDDTIIMTNDDFKK